MPIVVSEPLLCGDRFGDLHMRYVDRFRCGSMRSAVHVSVNGWFRDLDFVIMMQRS